MVSFQKIDLPVGKELKKKKKESSNILGFCTLFICSSIFVV